MPVALPARLTVAAAAAALLSSLPVAASKPGKGARGPQPNLRPAWLGEVRSTTDPRSGSWPLFSACKVLMSMTTLATADLTCRVSTLRTRSSRPRPRWRRCESSPWHGPWLRFAPCQRGR